MIVMNTYFAPPTVVSPQCIIVGSSVSREPCKLSQSEQLAGTDAVTHTLLINRSIDRSVSFHSMLRFLVFLLSFIIIGWFQQSKFAAHDLLATQYISMYQVVLGIPQLCYLRKSSALFSPCVVQDKSEFSGRSSALSCSPPTPDIALLIGGYQVLVPGQNPTFP